MIVLRWFVELNQAGDLHGAIRQFTSILVVFIIL